jgi:hypothetical protein
MQLGKFVPGPLSAATTGFGRFAGQVTQKPFVPTAIDNKQQSAHQWKNEANGQSRFLGYYDQKPLMGAARLNIVG